MGEVAVGSGGAGGASAAMVSLIRPPPGNYYILVSTLSAPPAGTAAVLNVNAWGMWQALGLTVLAPNPTPTPARVARPSTTVCAALAAAPATASFWSTPLLGPLTGLAVVLVAAGVVVVAATLTAVGVLLGRRRGYACCCCCRRPPPPQQHPFRLPPTKHGPGGVRTGKGDHAAVPATANPMLKPATTTGTTGTTGIAVVDAGTESRTRQLLVAAGSPGSNRLLGRSPSGRGVLVDGTVAGGSSRLLTQSLSARKMFNPLPPAAPFVVAATPIAAQLSAASLAILAADGLDCAFCEAKNERIRELEAELAALRARLGGGGGGGGGGTTNRAAMLSYAKPVRGGGGSGHGAARRSNNVAFLPRGVATDDGPGGDLEA